MASGSSFFDLIGFTQDGWGLPLVKGALLTLEIAGCSYLLGLALGLLGAWAKLSGVRACVLMSELYTTVIRAVPSLLLIILLYYTGSTYFDSLMGLLGLRGVVELNGFATVVFCLGFIKGAYMTEVFRGAILALPRGMVDAGKSLALSRTQRFRHVTFPLMLRIALPGLSNLWQSALKDSSLVSIVGFTELLAVGKVAASQTKMYLAFLLVTALIFLILTLVSNSGFNLLNRKLNRGFAGA